MKIIIAGDGKVGAWLTRQLANEGHDITLIDSDAAILENTIAQYDVLSILGNCASMETLRQADVEHADLLIASTGSDETNLLCCMTAHGMNDALHTIARIRTPEYSETVHSMRDLFALSLTVSPERKTAAEIDRLLKYPGFLRRERFANGVVELVEIRLTAGAAKLDGTPLHQMERATGCKVLVCAVVRDGETIIPGGDFTLRENDRIYVTAAPQELTKMLRHLDVIPRRARSVLIVGGGRISYYLTKMLLRERMSVKIIERDGALCEQLAELLPEASIVNADASVHATLVREGLETCDALVLATGLDELNLVLSMYGTAVPVPQVITKLSRTENLRLLDHLSIGTVVSPQALSCETIIRYVRAMQNQVGAAVTVHGIADGGAEALEFIVDEHTPHRGEKLADLRIKKGVLIASLTRGSTLIFPRGDTCFDIGDRLVVVAAEGSGIETLQDLFEAGAAR